MEKQSTLNLHVMKIVLGVIGSNFTKDARHFQILYLGLFLVYGVFALNWEVSGLKLLVLLAGTIFTQLFWIKLYQQKYSGLKSALITGLGLCLLLNSTSVLTLLIASVLAISAKYTLRFRNKHLFNPANFGIISAIILFQDAWISPGQWGSNAMFIVVLAILGGVVLHKIGRLETSLVFLITLFALEYVRTVLYQGWEVDVLIHKFSSGTLLLFTFFMITDPMTIPNAKKARMIWSVILAFSTFICTTWMQIYTAPIWVLFFMTPITVWFDNRSGAKKFEWIIN